MNEAITPELMRRHGWEIKSVGDNGPSTPRANRNRYQEWRHVSRWNNCDQSAHAVIHDLLTGDWIYNGKVMTDIGQVKEIPLV